MKALDFYKKGNKAKNLQKPSEPESKLMNTVIESLPYPFYVVDVSNYKLEYANSAAYRLCDEYAVTCHALTHKQDQPCGTDEHPCPIEIVKGTKEQAMVEHTHCGKNGDVKYFELYAYPVFDSDGNVTHMIESYFDVTDRRQEEKKLHATVNHLELRVRERTAELMKNNEELKKRADQLRRMSAELMVAEQRERRRLAEVLHDLLQQQLVAAKLHLELVADSDESGRQQIVGKAIGLITESIQTSRTLTAALSPQMLKNGGLAEALKWLAGWMQEKYMLNVELQIDPRSNLCDEGTAELLFQSVRELLFNVVRHAKAAAASVRMGFNEDGCLQIVVSDKGVGFEPGKIMEGNRSDGFGLYAISQRLEPLGGRLEIESAPGSGASFTLIAPCRGVEA